MFKTSLFFAVITVIYLCPAIPMTVKGMIGVIFIIISGAETSMKGSLITALFLSGLQIINFLMNNNVDFGSGVINVVIGSLMYCVVSVYFGRCADKLKEKNRDLQKEIEMRRNIEKELKDNLSLMESLMSTLPTPVSFKDLDFKFTGCNAAYEEYFEVSEQEILGKTAGDLFDTGVADICRKMEVDLLENRVSQAREVSFVSKGGVQKYFVFTKALLCDDRGNPTGIVSVFLDTTDHQEHEKLMISIEEEKLIIDEMQKYDRLKTEFFSNISHELRTPLNVILCAIQLMEMNLDIGDFAMSKGFVKKNITSIKQNSLRLLRLVNNLIDITKIDVQAFEINLCNQDIVYAVKEIVLSVADFVTNKGLKLVFHSDINEKIMAFDEEKLERIVLNLLSNAIKFSPLGESIYVDLIDNGDHICIRVKDKGIGIPHDCQQDIFQRFYQISPIHTRLREGSGIGLNLVKSLVELHQGTITLESEYGKGATFIVMLPAVLLPEEAAEKDSLKDRQARIENVQLEFSDIYLVNQHESNDLQQIQIEIDHRN